MKEYRPSFRFEYEEEPKTIEVSQDDVWKIGRAPDTIETTGLGPCVGVIIYDSEKKEAMVGHFVDPRIDDFKGMLSEAQRHFSNIKNVKVFIGGGAPDSSDYRTYQDSKDMRNFVDGELQAQGFQEAQITKKYQNSMESTILRIDLSDGNVEYDTVENWDEVDDYSDYNY